MAKHVYGPVPSRRLGFSLGVDLVPPKTCTMSCVYCQLGLTPRATVARASYSPVDEVVEDVRAALERGPKPDSVTLGGSGEPTLHSAFGEIAQHIRKFAPCPIALLTNGTLFYLPEVRAACSAIDIILPTLDAGDQETFERIHRPHPDITLEKLVQGLAALREEFHGQIWLEVFLVPGLNMSDKQVQQLRTRIARVRPDKVQLNTAVRPPAESSVRAATVEEMEKVRAALGTNAEVIAEPPAARLAASGEVREQDVLNMLSRRPCTAEDVSAGLGINPNEVNKCLRGLLDGGKVLELRKGKKVFYRTR